MAAADAAAAAARTRDPERREKIVQAAADLVARSGFHAVSMADIGAEAGITGSGIYRHFDSKAAILIEMFERVIDDLCRSEQQILLEETDPDKALDALIADQVELVVANRKLAQVYHNEIRQLPEVDRVRLRRKQRGYLEEWARLVRRLRPTLDEAAARALVHAAIGAVQSPLFHTVALSETRLRGLLAGAARSVLTGDPL